jgi:hypothetical protein
MLGHGYESRRSLFEEVTVKRGFCEPCTGREIGAFAQRTDRAKGWEDRAEAPERSRGEGPRDVAKA